MKGRTHFFATFVSLVVLAGCAAQHPLGTSPLTPAEHQFFARADPSAAIVTGVGGNTIEVTNNTFPARLWTEIIGDKRATDIFLTVGKTYPNASNPYQIAAKNYCLQLGLWPSKGVEVAPHTQRFTCLDPISATLFYARETAQSCERKLSPSGTQTSQAFANAMRQSYYTQPSEEPHICSPRNVRWHGSPPPNFCTTYTETLGFAPDTTLTCSDFVSRYTKASGVVAIASGQSAAMSEVINTSPEATQCIQMGFKQGSPDLANCQLQLQQLAMQQRQFESQQKLYEQQMQALQQQQNYNQAQALFEISAQAYGIATGANQGTTVITSRPPVVAPLPIAPIRITPPSGNPYTCAYQGARLVCR